MSELFVFIEAEVAGFTKDKNVQANAAQPRCLCLVTAETKACVYLQEKLQRRENIILCVAETNCGHVGTVTKVQHWFRGDLRVIGHKFIFLI